jgi:hypothetical protein
MRLLARHLLGLAVGAIAMSGLSVAATAAVIDFEGAPYANGFDLTAGPNPITGSSLTYTVSVSNTGSDTALVFDTTPNVNPADDDMWADFTDIDTNEQIDPGNVAVIGNVNGQGEVDDTNNAGTMTFTLSSVVDFVNFRVFDVGDNSNALTIEYFDSSMTSLGSQNVGSGTSDNETQLISFGTANAGIAAFKFGGSGGIDDIRFEEPGTDIPEPATLALIGSGLLAAGALMRRRRRA